MPLTLLQHLNIRCSDIDRSRDFYLTLGLQDGWRPPFASRGFWMYLGAHPVVHLVAKKHDEQLRGPDTGELDHVAFEAADIDAMRIRLRESGIAFRETVVPHDRTIQIFIKDPDGVRLELNFPQADKA